MQHFVSGSYDIIFELLNLSPKMCHVFWKIVRKRETCPSPAHPVERHVSHLTFSRLPVRLRCAGRVGHFYRTLIGIIDLPDNLAEPGRSLQYHVNQN